MGQRHPIWLRVDAHAPNCKLFPSSTHCSSLSSENLGPEADLVARRRTRPKIHVHVGIACESQTFSLINTLCSVQVYRAKMCGTDQIPRAHAQRVRLEDQ